MAPLKSEGLEDAKPPITPPPHAQNELEIWEKLAFTFDTMDHHSSGSSRPRGSRITPRSGQDSVSQSGNVNRAATQDAELLAQFAAANSGMALDHGFSQGLPPTGYPSLGPTPGFYGNFFHHDSMVPSANQLPPMANMDFPWPHMSPPPQQHGSLPYHHNPPVSAGGSSPTTSTFVPSPYPIPPPPPQMESSSSRGSRGRSVSSAGEELTGSGTIKKKQKTVNLERSVSDLTGRAEELEKEVADLRRENGWLKEIVMLKGTRIASANMAHPAAMVGPQGGGSANLPSGSSSGQNDEESEEESDSSDDDTVAKGKGKPDSSATRRK
ncbi:hypothetical protein FA13DRAFT_1707240 [Coprinellus micaceus]|uniref:BZIP domain-containing protein n=1 Tax=Coprinellus micaceus TaxID=71717 RepID=A0A4Y7TLQ0_COPMI|nr:hypothetical protein FA13DRAFT_1707240 [Coprinellus micaceus]